MTVYYTKTTDHFLTSKKHIGQQNMNIERDGPCECYQNLTKSDKCKSGISEWDAGQAIHIKEHPSGATVSARKCKGEKTKNKSHM